ncbi:MAG: VWA domain-containing protein [Blastocatellia bacterium]|nr:VWA domain-containing protein [Blastocatellia bacterium]
MQTTHTRTNRIFCVLFTILTIVTGIIAGQMPSQAQCGAMDVAFVIDDTSSLQGSLDNIKSELNAILNDIQKASNNDYRLALVTFKDDVTVRVNFSEQNRDELTAQILALTASGGTRIPEASDEALNTVINGLAAGGRFQTGNFSPAFRDKAFKVIILLTDAPPGGFDDFYTPGIDDKNAHDMALLAKGQNIKISAIYLPTFPEDTALIKPIMQDYATTTAGFYLETNRDGTGTADAIKTIVSGCGSTTTVPSVGQGIPSDAKTGSVLFYNLYASDIAKPNLENTLINITNTNEDKSVSLRVFFVDSVTGRPEDFFVCLPPGHHRNLLASEYDPGNKGFIVIIAVGADGYPINHNHLIGSANVKLKSGHQAHLPAVAFSALTESPGVYDDFEETISLKFDGIKYDFTPRVLSIQNFASPADATTLLVVNRFGGNLTKTQPVGVYEGLSTVMYNDVERAYNVGLSGGASQTRSELKDGYPRVLPRFSQLITAGRTAWMRFSATDGVGLLGASLTTSANTVRNGGTNLHQVALMDRESYIISVVPPHFACQ